MTTSRGTTQSFAPGTSRGPTDRRRLAIQMAMELERQAEVAARIKELRGPKPQPVIADAVGVRLRTYQHWEAGDGGIAWENLQKLADVFAVSADYLLYGEREARGPQSQLDQMQATLEQIASDVRELMAQGFQRELEESDAQDERREHGSEEDAAGSGE